MRLEKDVLNLRQDICNIRRELHQIPETAFNEVKTSEYIINYLKRLHIDDMQITRLAKTGIKVVISVNHASRTLAFRADMDALFIQENNQIDFISKYEGKMHACGHDGHMAILLAFAKLIAKYKNRLKANIVLIFQPAEEGPGGAEVMIRQGALDNPKVDEIYGIHLFPDIPEGSIGVLPGPFFARVSEFDITIRGKSAHGAMPHNGIDAILAASQLVNLLQSIVSRNTDPMKSAVITIGKITAGSARNILAENAFLEGTLRTFDDALHEYIIDRINKAIKSIDLLYGCKSEFINYGGYPAVVNDSVLTQKIIDIACDSIVDVQPVMIAEDFSFYQKEVPGVFIFLGTGNPQKGFIYPLHSNKFNFDESVLLYGVQIYKNLIAEYLM